jgi:hypothetical protein
LFFTLRDGFIPSQGDIFDFLIADIIAGAFEQISLPNELSQLGFGVSLVDLPGGQQQALRLAVQAAHVPLPGTLVMLISAVVTLLSFNQRRPPPKTAAH